MLTRLDRWLPAVTSLALLLLAACDSGTDAPLPAAQPERAPAPGRTAADPDSPSAETDRPVVSETLPYAEVGDQLVYGYFAFPADMVDPLPGVIVIHERWGLDDRTRNFADRIAAQGYVVLAVDLYGGQTSRDPAIARQLMVGILENPEPSNENIRQAYQFLADSGQAPRIGTVGWSLGGSWALNAALLLPGQLDAAVIYYGQVTGNADRLAALDVPILGLFGENDKGVTPDAVRDFEQALQELGKDYEIHIYPGAGHAFADPDAANYNPAAAADAWDRTISFLGRHLSAAP